MTNEGENKMYDKYDIKRANALRILVEKIEFFVTERERKIRDATTNYETDRKAFMRVYEEDVAAINEQEVADAFQNAPVIEFDVRGVEVEHDQALERDSWDRADRAVKLDNNKEVTP